MKTLEQEFSEYQDHHKYEMITSALMMCEDEGIYEERLLNDYRESDLAGDDRAFFVADDLYDRLYRGEKELYNQVYEMCWKRICTRIDDQKSYRIGVNYDED